MKLYIVVNGTQGRYWRNIFEGYTQKQSYSRLFGDIGVIA